jgi:hypothetical protein
MRPDGAGIVEVRARADLDVLVRGFCHYGSDNRTAMTGDRI